MDHRYSPLIESRKFTKFEAWIDLLLSASHMDHVCGEVRVKRGQVLTSQVKLADKWRWSRKKVIRHLRVSEKFGEIVVTTCPQWTLVTICNYDKYQGGVAASAQPKAQPGYTISNGNNGNKGGGVVKKKNTDPQIQYPDGLDDYQIQQRIKQESLGSDNGEERDETTN